MPTTAAAASVERSIVYSTTNGAHMSQAHKRRRLSGSSLIDSSRTTSLASTTTTTSLSDSGNDSTSSLVPGTMGVLALASKLQPTLLPPSSVATPVKRGIMSHVLTPSGGGNVLSSRGARQSGNTDKQKQASASTTRTKATRDGEAGGSLLAQARNMMPAAATAAPRARTSSTAKIPLLQGATQLHSYVAAAEVERVEAHTAACQLLDVSSNSRSLPPPPPAASAPPPVSRPAPSYLPTQPISTLLSSLDTLLAHHPLHASGVAASSVPLLKGLPPGSLMELTGPPGSGKTAFMAGMAVQARLQSLLRQAQLRLVPQAQEDQSLPNAQAALTWEVMASQAEQVLVIDTEGGLLPPRLLQAARAHVKALSAAQVCLVSTCSFDPEASASGSASTANRTLEAKEAFSRKALLQAVLSGLLWTRSTCLASLIAYLQLCFPESNTVASASGTRGGTAERSTTLGVPDVAASHLPPRTSLVVLDSLSHHLRAPDSGKKVDRQARSLALSTFASAAARAKRARITFVVSNQMSVKMFTMDGQRSSFGAPLASGMCVPQLVKPTLDNEQNAHPPPPPPPPNKAELICTTNGHSSGPPRNECEAARAFAARPSTLGRQTWRVLLFKAGEQGQCYAQIVARPISATPAPAAVAAGSASQQSSAELPWHTWIPFDVDAEGTPREGPFSG